MDTKRTYNFLAFDLGATSGRSILGTLSNGVLELKELTRFPNKIIRVGDKYYWNVYSLYESLLEGLKAAAFQGVEIDSIGIDTWGVDFVYVAEDGTLLNTPRCYRDPYTDGAPEEFFKIVPKEEVYGLTGIQIMNFNSLFQLYAAKKEGSSALKYAKSILFMPDALTYLLTGEQVCEYTIASTSQFINPYSKTTEPKLFAALDISAEIVPSVIMPGQVCGYLKEQVAKDCGLDRVPVIAVAGHDTASAVVAVPAEDENFAYLSSGTWSLMGVEADAPVINDDTYAMNFTNEGGVDGTIRLLKNITGMWLLEQCRKEWEAEGRAYTYHELTELSQTAEGFEFLVDPDSPMFANPESMTAAIAKFCEDTGQGRPSGDAEFIRCIFDSLAFKYRYVLECLRQIASKPINKLHIIGGGSKNTLLNQMTANATGIPVVAGPGEATALGNIMMQAKGMGVVGSLQEIRDVIRVSVSADTYYPENTEKFNAVYGRFVSLLGK